MKKISGEKQARTGIAMKKLLLLLNAGLALLFTRRPDKYARIVNLTAKEWRKLNKETFYKTIRRLYQSKLIDYRENPNGTVRVVLTDSGKEKILQYDIENIKLKKPTRWDRIWRLVIFDIPDERKGARDTLAKKLKELEFYPIQESVFVSPYPCKDEIDFVIEVFRLRPYVRYIEAMHVDTELHLKKIFSLI